MSHHPTQAREPASRISGARRRLSDLLRQDSGNVATLFGLALLPVVIGAGAAVDYSRLGDAHSRLQLAADAAALAGAKALASGGGQSNSARERAAISTASDVVRDKEPQAGKTITPSSSSRTVQVALTLDKPLTFGGLLGFKARIVAVSATATYSRKEASCFIALGAAEPIGIDMTGSPTITAPKCRVSSNSATDTSIQITGSPQVTARRVCAAGLAEKARNNTSPPAESRCAPAPDPYAERIPASTGGTCLADPALRPNDPPRTLPPGTYCGLTVSGGALTLLPGQYEIRGPVSIQGSASLTGEGVSLLLRGPNANLDVLGEPQIKLTAMSTGPLAGIAIASAPSAQPLVSTLQGSPNISLTGSLYLPNQRLKLQGSPALSFLGPRDAVAALSYDLHGSPAISLQTDDLSFPSSSFAELYLMR